MITRRVFGFLAGATPVFGNVAAKAAMAAPVKSVTLSETAAMLVPTATKASDAAKQAATVSKKIRNMRNLLDKASKFASGPEGFPLPDIVQKFDADLLVNRSMSLACAEYIQRQRDRDWDYTKRLQEYARDFENLFGVPFELDKLNSGSYTDLAAIRTLLIVCRPAM